MPAKRNSSKKEPRIIEFKSGERVDLGGGSFSNLLLTRYSIKGGNRNMMGYSVFRPGIDTKQKIHVRAEELAYVVSGSGKLSVGEKLYSFKSGDSLYIPQGLPHGVRNDGTEEIVMVFFFSSPSYPKTKDA